VRPQVYTAANVEAVRARCRAALGPALFERVYAFLHEARGAGAGGAAGAGGVAGAAGTTSGGGGGGGGGGHLRTKAFAARLLAVVEGDRALMPACAEVEQLLYMEAVVAANEARRATAAAAAAGAGAPPAAAPAGGGAGGNAASAAGAAAAQGQQ
jgi:hypothetical protein